MSVPITCTDFVRENGKPIEIGIRSKLPDHSSFPQVRECELKRYAAYFKGWCQAFGEHESVNVDANGSYWLLADKQVGLILPKPQIKSLYREVLLHEQIPSLTFSQQGVHVGEFHLPFSSKREKPVLSAVEDLVEAGSELHVYLTSHLLYGYENRIITISSKKPLSIIYKEIGTMHIRLL